jgi:hypothetical protein
MSISSEVKSLTASVPKAVEPYFVHAFFKMLKKELKINAFFVL